MRSDESDKISFDTEAFATLLILLIVDSTTLLFLWPGKSARN